MDIWTGDTHSQTTEYSVKKNVCLSDLEGPKLFSETKFSETETFFPRLNFLKVNPRLFFETKISTTETKCQSLHIIPHRDYRQGPDEAPQTSFYQWVVFMMVLQAALFYLPYKVYCSNPTIKQNDIFLSKVDSYSAPSLGVVFP